MEFAMQVASGRRCPTPDGRVWIAVDVAIGRISTSLFVDESDWRSLTPQRRKEIETDVLNEFGAELNSAIAAAQSKITARLAVEAKIPEKKPKDESQENANGNDESPIPGTGERGG